MRGKVSDMQVNSLWFCFERHKQHITIDIYLPLDTTDGHSFGETRKLCNRLTSGYKSIQDTEENREVYRITL